MSPEKSHLCIVGIKRGIGITVVGAMSNTPLLDVTLRSSANYGQKILKGFGTVVGIV
jgi:hypothetical protein